MTTVSGFVGDVQFQLRGELSPDLRDAYEHLLEQACGVETRDPEAGRALRLEYDHLAERWRRERLAADARERAEQARLLAEA